MLVPARIVRATAGCRRRRLRRIVGTAIVARVLQRRFLVRVRGASEISARRAVLARLLWRAKFADAAADFIAVEMRVAAVKERCKGAVVEAQQRRERAFGRAISVPSARQRTHASDQSAAKESNDIDLMCALTEHHPAAALGDQLLRSPRAAQ